MKKVGGSLLALNLFLSIVAFCFIINMGVVNAQPPSFNGEAGQISADGKWKWTDSGWVGNKIKEKVEPPTTPQPTYSMSSTQEGIAWLTGENWVAPKGYEWVEKEKVFKFIGKGGASGTGYSISGIIQGAGWALSLYLGIKTIGGLFIDDDAKLNAIASGAATGLFVGKSVYSLIGEGGKFYDAGSFLGKHASGISLGAGVFVGALILFNSYKSSSTETVAFTCYTWDAPTGGANCEKCNQGTLPCSEYQCRSLGQSCQLVNPGTDEEKCVWVNKNDVTFPTITPWNDALTDGYKYSPDNTISPPDRGVKIVKQSSTTGCVKAFEPISFGITTNEPAKCKIDYLRKENFDDMSFYLGASSTLKYNHSQTMALPGASTEENSTVILQNNGNFALFVRCQDANGNYNTGNFVFKYCVEKGPDTTPPLIVTTNLLNDMPIAFNQTEVNLDVYVNEPAECRWSHLDRDFKDMEEAMSCASSVFNMNAQMLYKCTTTLTGLKSSQENKFYFRCKDQPGKPENERNTNAESYKFTLLGTQPLVLSSVGPNGTIKDSTESIKVTLTARTDAGYKEGESICYYSNTEDNYVMFFDTESYTHSQDLYLSGGNYQYWIKCVDLGGNSAIDTTKFSTESDISAPMIVRTYHEESYLKLITDEEAECVYDITNCNYLFDDGKKISTIDDTEHFVDWNTKTNLYVKCKDKFGNQPASSRCNIIVRAYGVN
ncbi:MAG: hypothetical protein KKF67_02900 [Nanoarchaeota archaeon]|nr:hypothetical protein [Nanoarchaeota archaeon]